MNPQTYIKKGELYGITFSVILDREKYKGRGRSKKTDYMTFERAQKRINKIYNEFLDYLRFKT